jgi:hypothetical protein
MHDARWQFFDLGNTPVSEKAATECRIERLAAALERYGKALFDRRGASRLPASISAIRVTPRHPSCRKVDR